MRKYSIIIPLYNRPDEIRELLESLTKQIYTNFEVLVIEDGSKNDAKEIVASFADRLEVRYFFKENSGQGFTRNFGFEHATGDYFIIFDSDCIIPTHYLAAVEKDLNAYGYDLYGGPDAASPDFNQVQKAISYAMTSPFSTGGIRGKKKTLGGKFHPRSFNMGLSRKVYEKVGGFIITRMGEDIEFSIRIIRAGFQSGLIPDAYVYHKRRSTFGQFFKQLHFFGRARINISRFFPEELKLVHWFPALFFLFCCSLVLWLVVQLLTGWPLFTLACLILLLYVGLIFLHATVQTHSIWIGLLSIRAVFTQLTGYGIGFLTEGWRKWFKS
ncbi:glycosyltransferase [Cytophagaceae bacterium DM2B3-1]|uniref:Glycosyltransferase n=1 Tax=Xanthocytophaga flava TaxID=3048013 RepID=A0ABT7CV73_9BACT|nr:glycosyltransferase [Xanthocytophaga flavus]MDJ1496524.1 glycosyltransferase [Xanthocytophaga flavus]